MMEFLLLFFGALALGAFVQERVVPDVRKRWALWQQQRKADAKAAEMARVSGILREPNRLYLQGREERLRHYDATQANAVYAECQSCGKAYYMTHVNKLCVRCRGWKS